MPAKNESIDKIDMTNTKKEMLEAYNTLLEKYERKDQLTLAPEKAAEEKTKKTVVEKADKLSEGNVTEMIGSLKLETIRTLNSVSEKLEEEISRYDDICAAIKVKEGDLKEIYEIEKSAYTLSALIEAQSQRRKDFEIEMAEKKDILEKDITQTRESWEIERKQKETEIKEKEAELKTRLTREKEEFEYNFKREKQLARDKYADEKENLEKELKTKKEEFEKEYSAREKAVSEREKEYEELKAKASEFPAELEASVNKAVEENETQLKKEYESKISLLEKEFAGEKNVLSSKIEMLEKSNAEQEKKITELSAKLEKAYQKVQEVAEKAIDGASNIKSFNELQKLFSEKSSSQGKE